MIALTDLVGEEGQVHQAADRCEEGQDDQRYGHNPGAFMRMFGRFTARLAEEDQLQLAPDIEGGSEGGDKQDEEDKAAHAAGCGPVFHPSTRNRRKGQCRRGPASRSDRLIKVTRMRLAQAAHRAHILGIETVISMNVILMAMGDFMVSMFHAMYD